TSLMPHLCYAYKDSEVSGKSSPSAEHGASVHFLTSYSVLDLSGQFARLIPYISPGLVHKPAVTEESSLSEECKLLRLFGDNYERLFQKFEPDFAIRIYKIGSERKA
ncbi:hypothetical protein STEG23_031561, partial [Scotinomys teguina]